MRTSGRLVLASLLLFGCAGQLNASVPTPRPGQLREHPGAWVAYNLGCAQGCDQIRRGDIITAIDGAPITTGAQVDAADLARGTPVRLQVHSRAAGGPITVDLLATPNEYLRPLDHVPPLWTAGTEALDRAPEWARLKAFAHATPAMRLYRIDEPRAFVTGRQLYGRHNLILYWSPDNYRLQNQRRNAALAPELYAQLQSRDRELQAAGVDALFLLHGKIGQAERAYLRGMVEPQDATGGLIPIFANRSEKNNGNTVGLQHQAADLNELVFNDGHVGPIVLIIDARGIVRWHSRGWHREDPRGTIDAAIEFAIHELGDAPAPPADPTPTEPPPAETAAPAEAAPSTVAPAPPP